MESLCEVDAGSFVGVRTVGEDGVGEAGGMRMLIVKEKNTLYKTRNITKAGFRDSN